jgi:hypothetical protein
MRIHLLPLLIVDCAITVDEIETVPRHAAFTGLPVVMLTELAGPYFVPDAWPGDRSALYCSHVVFRIGLILTDESRWGML